MTVGSDISKTSLATSDGRAFQSLRRELGVTSFGLNLLTLGPGERGRVHAHDHQEEVYLTLSGRLTLILGDGAHVLSRHDLMRVAPHVRRQLANDGDEPVVVLALGGAGTHVGRDGKAWASWDDPGPGRPPSEIPLPADSG